MRFSCGRIPPINYPASYDHPLTIHRQKRGPQTRSKGFLSTTARYGAAVAAVAAAFALRLALPAWVGPGLPVFVTFYPAVMLAALLAGFGPGLAATAAASVAVGYWILPPVGQFAIASPVDRLGLAIFAGMGLFMSAVAELYRRSNDRVSGFLREESLREIQARLAAFEESTFEGTVEGEAGRIVECNERFAQMLGRTVLELVGMEIAELTAPEDRDRVAAAMRSGGEVLYEHAMVRKDGARIDVQVHARPFSPGGARRFAAVRDLTGNKRMAEELKKRRIELQALFNHSNAGLVLFDAKPPYAVLAHNRSYQELFAEPFRTMGMVGKNLFDYAPAVEAQGVVAVFDEAVRTKQEVNLVDFPYESNPPMKSWFNWHLSPVIQDGEIVALASMSIDVTAQHAAREALRESEEKYRRIIETATEGIVVAAPEGRMTFLNQRWADMLGYAREELLGKTGLEFLEKGQEPSVLEIRAVVKGGAVISRELKFRRKDGSALWALVNASPLLDGMGRPVGNLMMHTDITELKKAEEVLKRDKEAIERLVQEKTERLVDAQVELERAKRLSDVGMLASTVAHELRNPLAAINLAAHNIKRKANNPDLEKHLATIGKKVSESGQIINNLLFYSRLKPPHREPVDLFGVIEEALDMMEEGLKKPVSVVRNFDVLKNLSIDADPVQIKEVFHNILNNAQDAVPDDGGRIRVTAENGGEFIRVAIEDNGPGMGKDVLEKVFDPFFTTKAKGTGLGLSVCKQIVAMHEGDIEIKSEPGRGSSVIVRLRVKEKTGAK